MPEPKNNAFCDFPGISRLLDEECRRRWLNFWSDWKTLARYQADIAASYRTIMFMGLQGFQGLLQLAPRNLAQNINPLSFSIFDFTREIKGSTELEGRIVTEVAGYGSQLGIILDVLELILQQDAPKTNALTDAEAVYKRQRLVHLMEDIRNFKERAAC
ncbi:hypothetical protein [Azohydromonas aeria]|uniref:hypothetical protein n=1 Tax=Azohydromonas aeria TaxID=2590212 RepID=UPI0012FA33BC|nr:hypothetical protein [Azohydromonas aeria]